MMAARGTTLAAAALAAVLVTGSGCAAHGPHSAAVPRAGRAAPAAPRADSVTIGLWRFDENGGTRCADAGPYQLTGAAGLDTRTDFGRFHGARVFQRTEQSFVHVPFNPTMESPRGFTVEAWIQPNTTSWYELQCIAARWTPIPNEQSWVFGVSGRRILNQPAIGSDGPGWFRDVTSGIAPDHLVFIFQPREAAAPRVVFSTSTLTLGRWTHVAATVDGEVVRLWVGGRVDAQSATLQSLRPSDAPLVVGNVFDTHRLSDFGGDLRIDTSISTPLLYYGFDGTIDELRLSNASRTSFESLDQR